MNQPVLLISCDVVILHNTILQLCNDFQIVINSQQVRRNEVMDARNLAIMSYEETPNLRACCILFNLHYPTTNKKEKLLRTVANSTHLSCMLGIPITKIMSHDPHNTIYYTLRHRQITFNFFSHQYIIINQVIVNNKQDFTKLFPLLFYM